MPEAFWAAAARRRGGAAERRSGDPKPEIRRKSESREPKSESETSAVSWGTYPVIQISFTFHVSRLTFGFRIFHRAGARHRPPPARFATESRYCWRLAWPLGRSARPRSGDGAKPPENRHNLTVDALGPVSPAGAAMNESEKQCAFTRAASSTSGREKQMLISSHDEPSLNIRRCCPPCIC